MERMRCRAAAFVLAWSVATGAFPQESQQEPVSRRRTDRSPPLGIIARTLPGEVLYREAVLSERAVARLGASLSVDGQLLSAGTALPAYRDDRGGTLYCHREEGSSLCLQDRDDDSFFERLRATGPRRSGRWQEVPDVPYEPGWQAEPGSERRRELVFLDVEDGVLRLSLRELAEGAEKPTNRPLAFDVDPDGPTTFTVEGAKVIVRVADENGAIYLVRRGFDSGENGR